MKNFSEINRVFTTKKRFLSFLMVMLFSVGLHATTWTVAGAPAALFGTEWTPSLEANDMTLVNGLYKWTKENVTLSTGTFQFKVCANHAWDLAYPSSNYVANIGEDGTYDVEITFNESSKAITATATKKSSVVINHSYTVVGDLVDLFGTAWAPSLEDNDMALVDGLYTWSKNDVTLPAATIYYKIVQDHSWGTEWPSSGNYDYVITQEGKYNVTVTFDYAHGDVTFVAELQTNPEPETPVKYYIIGSEAFGNWSFVPVYKDTFEIKDLADGDHMFRIAFEDGNWDNCVGFSHLTETPAGVTGNNDNNILFTYTEAGDFKVVYNSTEFKVFGNFYVAPAEPKKYYAKYAPDWSWKLLTEKDGLWLTDTIVYGGIGININDADADENNMFYSNTVVEQGVRPIAGAEIAENDTVLFSFNPADSVLTAVLVGKYVEPKYDFEDGFYLVGDKYNWTPAAERLLLANTETEGEYYLADVTLSVDDSIKVVWVEKDVLKDWYPDGDNYVVDADHAGVKTIYFNPTWQIDWNGNIFIAPNPKYYAKYAPDWTWKLLTEKDGLWLTDTIVYGGIGININDADADENNMFYSNTVVEQGVRPIAGAEIAENDTILFSFNPADSVLTAVLVGKYVAPVPAKFYIVGDSALVTDGGAPGKAWTPDAIKSEVDTFVLNLKANQRYMLKITKKGDWEHGVLGYDALTGDIPMGITRGVDQDEDNIIFSLAQAGAVNVIYKEGETPVFRVEGDFAMPSVAFAGDVTNWAHVPMTVAKDKLSASVTLENLTAGVDSFKIVLGGQWISANGEGESLYTFHRGWKDGANIKGGDRNMLLNRDKAGDYTFTWIYANDSLHIDFPPLTESSVIYDTEDPNVAYTVKCGDATVTPSVKIVEGTKLFVKAESKKYEYIIKSLRAYKVENEEEVPVPIVNDTLEMPAADLHIVATVGFHEAKIAGLDGTWAGELLKTAEDGKSATVTLNLPFGPKTFKMIIDGNWLGEGEAFTRKAVAHKMTSLNSSTDATLDVDIKGDYTFTWNFADSTLTVGYPDAPDTVDIFFVNTFNDWANVYAYIYEDTIGVEDWPGVKMTKDEKKVQGKDLYKVTALTSYSTIVFNNGKSEGEVVGIDQTVDLLWDSSKPVYCDGKWYADTASVDEIEPAKYFLTGNEALVEHFGMASTSAWKGRIKAIEDTLVIENLAKGYYKLRVVNTKDQWIGFSQLSDQTKGLHADVDDNICFMMTNAGNVTVVYKESATDTIFTVKGDYETATVVALAGGFNDWDAFVNLFEVAEGGLKATLTTHLEAGIDSIKVVSDGNWLSLNGDGEDCFYIHRLFPQTGSLKATDLRNLVINADVAGDYTFTWTFADSTLAVAYPNLPKDDAYYAVAGNSLALFYHMWRPDHDFNYTQLKQQANGLFKWDRKGVVLPQGEVRFKICKDKSFDESWPADDYVLAIPENGEYTVTILFNAVSHEIIATAEKTGNATFHDPIDLKGSWDSWAEDHRCIIDEDNLKALITMNLTAGDYEFKFHNGDLWFGNGQEFTRANSSIRNIAENVDGNMILHADVDGDYIFTWIFDQNHAMIQFPSLVPAKKISRLEGEFSVSDSTKVNFSRGNLQYNFGEEAWYTAETQYEVLGDANLRLGDETYKGSIDLFSWSCESSNYGILSSALDADFTGDFKDWGELFAGEEDTWRTLDSTEFKYLLKRKKDGHVLWTCVALGPDSVIGLALFPDEWTVPEGLTVAKYGFAKNDDAAALKKTNYYSFEEWAQMEAAGAVVLPAGGARAGAWGNYVYNGKDSNPNLINPLTGSYCWISFTYNTGYYWLGEEPNFFIYGENAWGNTVPCGPRERRRGHNVRLVTEAKEPVVEPIYEIKFTEAAGKGALIDSTFTVEGSTFSVKTTDPDGKMSIDAGETPTRFGTPEEYTAYPYRLKTGGKSMSTKNYLTLTIPEDGILRLAVRSGKDAETDRMVYVIQNGDTIFQRAPNDAEDKTVISETEVYYPYYEMYVRAGEAKITYPVNGVNFYSFTFRAAEIPAKFYIIGNTAELGAWVLEDAIKSEEDSYTLHLEAGDYMMKVLTRGLTWDEGLLGYDELSVKKYGITRGEGKDENNICFTLNEAGDVVVEYKATVLNISGNFYVDPATIPHYFIAGTMTGWKNNMVEMIPGDNNTYTADIDLAAEAEYAFKVVYALGADTAWYGIEDPGTMVYGNCTNWQLLSANNNVGLLTTKAGAYTFTFVANDKRELSVNIPSLWDEIVFTESDVQAQGTDAFQGKVFTAPNSEFSITCHDDLQKIAIDANTATFGTEEDHTKYTHRIKTGGYVAYFDVNIPTDGILRLAARTGNNEAEDRTVVVIQNGDTIFQQAPKESDKVDGRYPYFEMYVHAGTAEIHTPVNSDGFYSFAHRQAVVPVKSHVKIEAPAHGKITVMNGEIPVVSDATIQESTKLKVTCESTDENYDVLNLRAFKTEDNTPVEIDEDGYLVMPDFDITITADEVIKPKVTLYFVNKPAWQEVHYYVWNDVDSLSGWPGDKMTKTEFVLEDEAASTSYDVYSCTFFEKYNMIIFNNGLGGGANQTSDQEWDSAKPYFYDGIWYATLEEIDTEAKATFYISGSKSLVGEGSLWDPKAIKSLEDSYTLDLNPGIYQLKISLDGTADTWRGFNELTSIADGLNRDTTGVNAIEFVIATPSSVVVTYKVVDDEVTFTLNGNFYTLADGYYLAGQDKWDVLALDETVKFEPNTSNPGEYVLSILLAAEDKIQAVEVKNNRIYWFGETYYTVDAAHAGNADVYFRPEYQENWYEFGGYIYVYVEGGGTGMDEIGNTEKAVKVMVNGQLLIIKNGKIYNGQGQLIR